MGTPASLLELIATGGSRRLALNAELTQRAAQAKQAEAAARHADAETEKANIEAEAMRQAQADQQVISDAFAHVGGSPALMDKYIKANASGAGVQRWQMDNQKIREQMAKASAADLDRAEKVHRVMGSSLAHLNEIPDEQLQAEYAKIAPAVQQLDPSVQLPQQIDRMGLKRLMGQLTYADEVLKTEKERAALKQTEQATANAAQEAALKERGAFLQAIRPDMSAEEYGSVRASFPNAAKSFPAAPGQWMRSAAQEAVKVGDRAKVEQDARVLAGMSPTGITAEQQARMAADEKVRSEQARHNKQMEGLQYSAQRIAQANSGVQREGMLRDDFGKESKNFLAIRDAYGKVKQAASTDSAAADVALIYGFMRILDPTSTVREGEFATAQNAGSIPDRVLAAYNRAISGGRLSPNIRQDFVAQTEKIYKQADQDHAKTERFYGDVAKRYGMDPSQVLPDYRSTFKDEKPAPAGKFVVTDPAGGKHAFDSQAQADAFKKAAGIR